MPFRFVLVGVLVGALLAAPLAAAKLPGGDPEGDTLFCVRLRNTEAPPDTCVLSDGSVCQANGAGGRDCIDPTP